MGKIIIIILLVCILAVNLTLGYFVLKHYDVYSNDPFVYAAQQYNASCLCSSPRLSQFRVDSSGVHYTIQSNQTKRNYDINLSNFIEVIE